MMSLLLLNFCLFYNLRSLLILIKNKLGSARRVGLKLIESMHLIIHFPQMKPTKRVERLQNYKFKHSFTYDLMPD